MSLRATVNAEILEHRLIVFDKHNAVVGYLSWLPEGFVGHDYITFVCVQRAARRDGIASHLMADLENRMRGGRVFVSTEADNEAMLRLLAKRGWVNAGEVAGANENDLAEVFFYQDF